MKIRFLLIALLISTFFSAQNKECERFKNGSFYYPSMPDKISVRNGSVQKSYEDENLEMIWDVNWINDCEYDLICVKILSNTSNFEVGERIKVKIVSSVKNCYYSMLTVYNKEYPKGYALPGGPFPLCKKE
ncbi:hypothetical protein [Flavobacterium sp.]|jgi:hypothetical protein|uniref:hypothetical protein n=1 Tax=Flavobacterium sp. TaxID=239 RepID=UPI002A82EC0D|nr:hypothetical protein [Flavobacterium sp.]